MGDFNFMSAMQAENNKRKTLTENGAVAYETSGKALTDFHFKLSHFRSARDIDIMKQFSSVFFEDPLTAVKDIFYIGDVRQGIGERKVFRSCMMWLANNKPEICSAVIPYVGLYNRFDSLLCLLDFRSVRKDVVEYIRGQLDLDIKNKAAGKPISLLAKWLPSENASSLGSLRLARILINELGWSPRKYRKTLSDLRAYIDVVERKMSANRWKAIDYEGVPSKANLIYNSAFLRHDEERRRSYLEKVKKGDAKINAKVLQPHEIVSKYVSHGYCNGRPKTDDVLEQLWKNLPDKTVENILVVRDGSGSMMTRISGNTTCLDVASALTIYMAERNSGSWKNKFVTFSSRPRIIDISNCETLRDKLVCVYNEDECSNTDIYKTMKLILETAVQNRISQEEMPGMIVICSDMGFDPRYFNFGKTLFEEIIDEYEAAGYKMPKICFWNINARNINGVPLQRNDLGLILCSGFSVNIMDMFLSNRLDPYEILLEQINSPRYDEIEEAVKDMIR